MPAQATTATTAKVLGERYEAKEEEKRPLFLAFIVPSDSSAHLATTTAIKPQEALEDGETRAERGGGRCQQRT
jgi:hypothetical protein